MNENCFGSLGARGMAKAASTSTKTACQVPLVCVMDSVTVTMSAQLGLWDQHPNSAGNKLL